MIYESYNQVLNRLSDSEPLSFDDSFSISKLCSKYLSTQEKNQEARDIIIRILNVWEKIDSNTRQIWNDLVEASGLYPYLDYANLSDSAALRYEVHESPYLENIYLHEEQMKISLELLSGKSVVVSAPTSFGKSLLIEETIASKVFKNIVIIQPTLALLDETRKKLIKYRDYYKIIVSTSQEPDSHKGNLYLFTGERVVEYQNFPNIDFFVIDEFYKLSVEREDDRAIVLNQAFYKLLKKTKKFYLLGPLVNNVSESFSQKVDFSWHTTNFATVAVDEHNIEIKEKLRAKERNIKKVELLFNLLDQLEGSTLIYCASPNKATQLSIRYASLLEDAMAFSISETANDISEWITVNIHRRWSLKDAIDQGIAFHHGALPRHLGSSIVDAFNEGKIKYLFCTSTLIEGVNTSAKNVILFDKEKGKKNLDFFDYKNIAGRSGRMKKHYIGNVYRFEKTPDQLELFLDIPLFNQEKAPIEVLINMNTEEIEQKGADRLEEFNLLPDSLKEVIKKNSSINVEGQISLVNEIEKNFYNYKDLLNWTAYPSFDQLAAVLELGWNFLLKPYDNKADVRSARQLAYLTNRYSSLKSIQALIAEIVNDPRRIQEIPDEQERIDQMTFYILNISRNWFEYKIPKWLNAISDMQQYIFQKKNLIPGNYSFYSGQIEHRFLPPSLNGLLEYDIPQSIITKLQRILKLDLSTDALIDLITKLSDDELRNYGLIQYEIKKIRTAL
ncbi:hypothetical protein CH373_18360 [Leptospira perolatii]|uniref:Helicase n=1 Tax=Leptospira perolatii TaxID=2023191 RepID=A0A2M9ZHX2_9LEPT|nr:DEAD/DEAH box helicase [Leptospira perolatii]PJZ70813.1 hypothetical protein CH360_04690 [Leptospira perolatii]PJZ71649.1 hypothetical protein CH373_18360 [Leptospira perolatii]